LLFDFRLFSGSAFLAYKEENPYSLEECLGVFRLYFQTYEEYMGKPHPPIRREQIARIMEVMPFLARPDPAFRQWLKEVCNYTPVSDIDPDMYPLLIRLHFKTKYRHCDYNINHFFSGKIRELRLHEAEAGYE